MSNKVIRKFKSKFLIEELDLPYNAIEDVIVEVRRFSILHRIVFEYDGKFYQTNYSVGATEYQDEGPWDSVDEVDCVEVEKRQVVVEKWLPVEVSK